MAGHRMELSDSCLKVDEISERKIISDTSVKISYGEGEKEDVPIDSYISPVKRYPMYDLLFLRNAQQSVHYPQCALRPKLQALSIWTCRLRCELQYLGLWKITNMGNPYGNCSCNGSCQSYVCDSQAYQASNSSVGSGYSQICNEHVQPLQTSAKSPIVGGKVTLLHHSNQGKPAFIDHRSISSSHLMPAFVKRRMGHGNTLHGISDSGVQYNGNGANNAEQLCNDDGVSEHSSRFETPIQARKELIKMANNQNDNHLHKGSANNRLDKSDLLVYNQSGMMNLVKKTNSDFTPLNNKLNNCITANKKIFYERRIGSGRLAPREVNWDVRTSNNTQTETELSNIVSNSGEKDKEISAVKFDKLNRNSSNGRYSDPRIQERRNFDRRITNSEDTANGSSCNTTKRYGTTNLGEDRNNFDSNYHPQATHFTGQRSMSFRRREYIQQKDYHRDFRECKDSREEKEIREPRGLKHQHRDHKEEPEWFSEGPTSQHDTIELRGFEEADDCKHKHGQLSTDQLPKLDSDSSETSAISMYSSSIVKLSTKDNFDKSSEVSNNSDIYHKDPENFSSYNNNNETPNKEVTNDNESKPDIQQPKSERIEKSDKKQSDAGELFFDNFLNIEALENTLIGCGNDQSSSANNDSGGTSRFSRWFFNNSCNVNSSDELNNNPANKEDVKQLNKDLNESDFNSFMSFLKCNNFPTPELPKGLPSNVSALSVEELEARMRKIDPGKIENTKNSRCDSNLNKNEEKLVKKNECQHESDVSIHSTEINTQDVKAFRKLLDQLGKPQVDISMNTILPNTPVQPQTLGTQFDAYSTGISPIESPNSLPQSNMAKQEYMMKVMQQQQQNVQQQYMTKMFPPVFQLHHTNDRIIQQNESNPLMSVSQHPNHMPVILGHPQNDIQHLIQSLARGEVSINLVEHELNKLYDTSSSGALKDRSRCGTPLASLLGVTSVPNSGSVILPSSSQAVSSQKDNFILTSENISSNQQKQQTISSISRCHLEDSAQHMPTQRELQIHTQVIMQNALFKKKIEMAQQESLRRRQEIQKQHELDAGIGQKHQHTQKPLNSNFVIAQQGHQQPTRHVNSPTPLAFTPTSVLRKMTADKESIPSSTQSTSINSTPPQTIQSHFQQPHLKISPHSQIPYQHSNQPRMILGGGNFQYMHQQQHPLPPPVNTNGSPQISPQLKSQIRNHPPGSIKWSLLHPSIEQNHAILANKPMGRPILKGPVQPLVTQSAHNAIGVNRSNVNQNPQSIQTVSQIQKYPPIQQQSRQIVGQQFSTRLMQHQIPTCQQNNIQQQLFQQQQQQQRSVVLQRQQIPQNDLGNHGSLQPPAHHPPCNESNSLTNLNFQRDGGLSPTSNQLAQWFSPELLAQASAGKLPLLNMNQALSLEEFERSIQHSSTAVNI